MRAMLRFLMVLAGLALILPAVLLLVAIFYPGPLENLGRRLAEQRLSRGLGSPVSIEAIQLHPRQTRLEVRGLTILNPEGFQEGPALRCARIFIDVAPFTLLGPTPRVRSVYADGLEVELRHELGRGTNLAALAEAAENGGGGEGGGPASAISGGRRLVVEELGSDGGRVHISSNLLPLGRLSMELAPFTVPLSENKVPPGQLVALCLRTVLQETTRIDGLTRPLLDLLQQELEKLRAG